MTHVLFAKGVFPSWLLIFAIFESLYDLRCVFFPQVCHSKSGEVNSSKVANLVKAYVDKYKHARKK